MNTIVNMFDGDKCVNDRRVFNFVNKYFDSLHKTSRGQTSKRITHVNDLL